MFCAEEIFGGARIASHTIALGAMVITRNLREFQRVPGLHVENRETEA
jgi:predicted nucleic acid-binding protein